LIEGNEIGGNSNGIYLTAGVTGNTIRRNTILGNPAVQVAADHSGNSGYDIKNLAAAGANTFVGNSCATSINAPCPSIATSFTASPNPIPVTTSALYGETDLSWIAPVAEVLQVRVNRPDGPLLATQGYRGSTHAGLWVADGTVFYLQDVTGGRPLTSDYTLATVVVHLQRSGSASVHFPGGPFRPTMTAFFLAGITLCAVLLLPRRPQSKRLRIGLGSAVLLAGVGLGVVQMWAAQTAKPPTPQNTADTLDRMVKGNKSSRELAQYVFDTHGCKSCHTMGSDGKLGFTAKGKERAQGFEGCISMLTAMTVIVQVPEEKRSSQQRQKAARFQEFGCTACHQLTPGKLSLTEVGAKLSHLHLGCVEVEKLVASGPASRR
jgi:parallel beta-helix repeat protein